MYMNLVPIISIKSLISFPKNMVNLTWTVFILSTWISQWLLDLQNKNSVFVSKNSNLYNSFSFH